MRYARPRKQVFPTIVVSRGVFWLCAAAGAGWAAEVERRPTEWAQPVQVEGLPNLHRVSGKLYRSAQPTAEGMRAAERLGIRTVVSLRSGIFFSFFFRR